MHTFNGILLFVSDYPINREQCGGAERFARLRLRDGFREADSRGVHVPIETRGRVRSVADDGPVIGAAAGNNDISEEGVKARVRLQNTCVRELLEGAILLLYPW